MAAMARLLLAVLMGATLDAAQAPSITVPAPQVLNEDFPTTILALTGIAPGTPGATVAITATSSNPAILPSPLVVYTSPATSGRLVLYPAADRNGAATVSITVTDSAGGATTAALPVTVHAVNDPPSFVLYGDEPVVMQEDSIPYTAAIHIRHASGGPADEGQAVTWMVSALDTTLMTYDGMGYWGGVDRYFYFALAPDRWGETDVLITAIDADGTANGGNDTFTMVVHAQVAAVPDPLLLTAGRALAVGVRGTVAITGDDLAVSDADQPAAAAIVWTLATPPAAGLLLRAGTALAAGGTVTQADIAAGLVAYQHLGDGPVGDQFALTCTSDGGATTLGPVQVAVAVAGATRPAVNLNNPTSSWTEGATPTAIAPAALVADGDSASLAGGSLRAAIASGSTAGDRLGILAQGDGDGQIGVAGMAVRYGGSVIGTWSGGSDASPLVVALQGAAASPAAVQALLRALAFDSTSDNPTATPRVVEVVVDDGDAGPSLPVTATVAVVPVNDLWVGRPTDHIAVPLNAVAFLPLPIEDPEDDDLFFWRIATQPVNATVTMISPIDAEVTITPLALGSGILVIAGSNGTPAAPQGTLTLSVYGPDDPRPHPLAEPPREVEAGSALSLAIPFDTGDVGSDCVLDFSLGHGPDDYVPGNSILEYAYVSVDPELPNTAIFHWQVSTALADGSYQRFTLIAADRAGRAAVAMPMLMRVVNPGQAVQ